MNMFKSGQVPRCAKVCPPAVASRWKTDSRDITRIAFGSYPKWLLVLVIVIAWGSVELSAAAAPLPYKDASLPVEIRLQDLLPRMTLDEKIGQLNLWPNLAELLKHKSIADDIALTLRQITNGVGAIEYDTKLPVEDFATFHTAVQRFLIEQTRLGIPALFDGEACHGFVGTNATIFPVPLALASTWDPALVEQVFTTVALEMRSYGITHAATPVLDLAREPRFGRFDEFYSEDPYLAGTMGVAAIRGLQGRNRAINGEHLLACAKHFTGHGQPEGGANMAPADFSERVIREMHCYPFEMAVKEANVRTVMAAYCEIDGVPCHINLWLLTDILRGEWGFDGYVISDYDGVSRMINRQFVCASPAEAARRALNAGMDFELPSTRTNDCFQHLTALIRSGAVKESVLDQAVVRILRNKFLLGLFENPYCPRAAKTRQVMGSTSHRALAREAAEKGIVLLKNENRTLPFKRNAIQHLAVIGPNADEVHYGSYSAPNPGISILDGLKTFGQGQFEMHYAEGFKIYENDKSIAAEDKTPAAEERRIAEAVATAQKCDAVLLVLGGNEKTCHESWFPDHFGDRNDLNLLGRQNDLARAVLAVGKPVAVLLINGRPLSINELATNAPAILEGWYLGQEQGTAVARVLFGDVNPGGKLTVTIPRSVGDLPVYYNHKPLVHEHPYVSGPYSPLYPFGHGLSYTTFRYGKLQVSPAKAKIGQPVTVSVEVSNVGDCAGDEVVQLYLRDSVSSVSRPVKELKDFRRIALASGETKTVSFQVTSDKLQFYNMEMRRVVEPGEFQVMVGASSVENLKSKFEITE
jgi:beta-glucosidase